MKCIACHAEAEAICKYCGRAVCSACAGEGQYKSGAAPKYFTQTARSAIVVSNAIWCGRCSVESA